MQFKNILSFLLILNIFNFINANNLDDKVLENTCLGKFTGVFHSFIYFAQNETSTDYYVIRTAWLITYPNRIKTELKKQNLYVYENNPTSKCDWTLKSKIQKFSIYTGFIYQKNNEVKNIQTKAGEILTSIYPSLEIGLICMPVIIIIFIIIFIYCKYKLEDVRRDNYNTMV